MGNDWVTILSPTECRVRTNWCIFTSKWVITFGIHQVILSMLSYYTQFLKYLTNGEKIAVMSAEMSGYYPNSVRYAWHNYVWIISKDYENWSNMFKICNWLNAKIQQSFFRLIYSHSKNVNRLSFMNHPTA